VNLILGVLAVRDYSLVVLDVVDSTNTELFKMARNETTGPLWLLAKEQTAGRGRRGAVWKHKKGNFAGSLLLIMQDDLSKIATLSFVAGLAIIDAIGACVNNLDSTASISVGLDIVRCKQGDRLGLKWPNDVLLDTRKIAGILVETELLSNGKRAVVVGIGVNIKSFPDSQLYNVASIAAFYGGITLERFFVHLSNSWARLFYFWEQGFFYRIINLWLDRAVGLGGTVSVSTGSECITGVFETVNPDGLLVMKARDETLWRISSGVAYFGSACEYVSHNGGQVDP